MEDPSLDRNHWIGQYKTVHHCLCLSNLEICHKNLNQSSLGGAEPDVCLIIFYLVAQKSHNLSKIRSQGEASTQYNECLNNYWTIRHRREIPATKESGSEIAWRRHIPATLPPSGRNRLPTTISQPWNVNNCQVALDRWHACIEHYEETVVKGRQVPLFFVMFI